jgi:hypothetical protein
MLWHGLMIQIRKAFLPVKRTPLRSRCPNLRRHLLGSSQIGEVPEALVIFL